MDMMDEKELIRLLEQHKFQITSASHWDEYAKQRGLPLSSLIVRRFGSWNRFKAIMGLPIQARHYDRSELKEIAIKHQEYFRSRIIWDKHARVFGLPVSGTFINAFGSWEQAKKEIGIQNRKRKRDIYDKESLKQILEEHGRFYRNRQQWDQYAKKNRVPTYKTLRKHFTYEELLQYFKQNSPKSE